MHHDLVTLEDCKKQFCEGCQICKTNLAVCLNCGLAQNELTAFCPGHILTGWLRDKIATKQLDFNGVRWKATDNWQGNFLLEQESLSNMKEETNSGI